MDDKMVCLTLKWGNMNQEYITGDEDVCLSLKKAHRIIKADVDDLFIAYNYIVTPDIAEGLKIYYKHQFDFNENNYFVCSYSGYECIDGKPVRVEP